MIGRLLSGRYRIEEVVGTGGMAVVYRAVDETTGNTVAVKVLRPEFETDAEFVARFRTEAEAAAKMYHENIVSVLDVGIEGDTRYIVMEYVEGQTLKSMIRSEGKIHPDVALRMAIRILAAVDHAHRNGIVHRDIKPQNILVDREGRIKVADFGIARLKAENVHEEAKAFGSVHYLSPEQAKGELADEQSDLYSVGVVLYEMLTGHVPFDGDTPLTVALKHVNERPGSLRKHDPNISKALDQVMMRALEKDRARRYQSAAEMAADLRRTITEPQGGFVKYPEPVVTEEQENTADDPSAETDKAKTNEPKPSKTRLKMRRHLKRVLLYGAIAAALLLAVIAGLYILITNRTSEVPAVTGLEEMAAVTSLQQAELEPVVVNAYSDEYPIGAVMLQSVEAGTRKRVGSQVTVTVSMGGQWYELPDMHGMSEADAVEILENAAVADLTVKYVDSPQPSGTVVSVNIPQGTTSRDTPVTLLISGDKVDVPDVLGMDREAAEAVLTAAGVTVVNVMEGTLPDAKPGTVIFQSIPGDTQALRDSEAYIIVCRERTVVYAPIVPLMLVVPMNNIRTVIELTAPSGETMTVYSGRPEKGSHLVPMTSTESGVHQVCVYMDDVLYEKFEIDFE